MKVFLAVSLCIIGLSALIYELRSLHHDDTYGMRSSCLFLGLGCPNPIWSGVVEERFERPFVAALEEHLRRGCSVGFTFAAWVDGVKVIDVAAGRHVDSDKPYEAEALQPIFSSGKMAMSVLTNWVASRYKGKFSVEDKISKHWPEFGAGGKENITMFQVLAHEGGVPWVDNVTLTSAQEYNEQIVDLLAKQKRIGHDGLRTYHATTRDNVVAEVLRRVTGLDANALMEQLCHELDDECTVAFGWREFRPALGPRVAASQYAHGLLYTLLRFALDGSWILRDKYSVGEESLIMGYLKAFMGKKPDTYHMLNAVSFFSLFAKETRPALRPEIFHVYGPSFSGVSNARSLAALASLVAHNGTWKGRQVIDRDVMDVAWERLPRKMDECLRTTSDFTKGGFGSPTSHQISLRGDIFMGWGGAGGSIVQANRAGIAFSYVPNTMQIGLRSQRAVPLIKAVVDTVQQHQQGLRDD